MALFNESRLPTGLTLGKRHPGLPNPAAMYTGRGDGACVRDASCTSHAVRPGENVSYVSHFASSRVLTILSTFHRTLCAPKITLGATLARPKFAPKCEFHCFRPPSARPSRRSRRCPARPLIQDTEDDPLHRTDDARGCAALCTSGNVVRARGGHLGSQPSKSLAGPASRVPSRENRAHYVWLNVSQHR